MPELGYIELLHKLSPCPFPAGSHVTSLLTYKGLVPKEMATAWPFLFCPKEKVKASVVGGVRSNPADMFR
jgi:hypothetical protein